MTKAVEIMAIGTLLLVCGYLSYTDVREKKIRNIYTYPLILIGLVFQSLLALAGATSFGQVGQIFAMGFAIGFLMYYIGVWSAGDAKLFWGASMTIPSSLLITSGPLVLISNSFILYFFIMTLYVIGSTPWNDKKESFLNMFNPKLLLDLPISFASFMGLAFVIRRMLPYRLNYFFYMWIFVVLFALVDKKGPKFRKKLMLVFLPVSLFILMRNPVSYMKMVAVSLCLFLTFRFFIVSLSGSLLNRDLEIADLKPGMVPAAMVVQHREAGTYRVVQERFQSLMSFGRRPANVDVVVDIKPEGLSENDLKKLTELSEAGALRRFKVQRSMPFAPVILTGVIVTLAFRAVFVYSVVKWIFF